MQFDHVGARKCRHLLDIRALSGYNTVSHLFGKGKPSTIELLGTDIPDIDEVLREPGPTQAQLKDTAGTVFSSLSGRRDVDLRRGLFTLLSQPLNSLLRSSHPLITNVCYMFSELISKWLHGGLQSRAVAQIRLDTLSASGGWLKARPTLQLYILPQLCLDSPNPHTPLPTSIPIEN